MDHVLVLKKFFDISITLFGVVTIIFFLFNVLPGDPAQMMLGQNENSEQLKILKKKYGFDKPVLTQYLFYLNDLSIISIHSKDPDNFSHLKEGKFSYVNLFETNSNRIVLKIPYLRDSYQKNGLSVSEIIKNTLPNTFVLAISAISIAIILGLLLGIFSALYKNTWIDYLIQIFSTLGMSVPSFFSAIIFAWLFGYVLSDLTGLNMTGSLYELDDYGEKMSLQLKNLILPSIVLGIRPIAVISQMMRNSLLKVLSKNYITTAYAKGLSRFDVIKNHAIKNSLNPVLTALSGWFASMLAGSVFVEYIFGWNGLGKEIVDALNKLDVPVLIGSVLTISIIFIMINIFVDIIYTWLDPRTTIKN
jgi:peptide/nickel transport system permease protein